MRLKLGIPKGNSGFISQAGFLGIIVCLVVFGGLLGLGKLIWPDLAAPWLVLIAFGVTNFVLLMIILLLPNESKPKD